MTLEDLFAKLCDMTGTLAHVQETTQVLVKTEAEIRTLHGTY